MRAMEKENVEEEVCLYMNKLYIFDDVQIFFSAGHEHDMNNKNWE